MLVRLVQKMRLRSCSIMERLVRSFCSNPSLKRSLREVYGMFRIRGLAMGTQHGSRDERLLTVQRTRGTFSINLGQIASTRSDGLAVVLMRWLAQRSYRVES